MSDLDLQAKLRHNALEFPWSEPPEQGHLRELADGLLWLRMPLPFGLDHINLYLLRHEHGWVVVDTGLNTDQSIAVWERVCSEVLQGEPVLAVIATHCHYDHTGMVVWLSDRFQCPVYMTFGEYSSILLPSAAVDEAPWQFRQFYQRAGLSTDEVDGLHAAVGSSMFKNEAPHSYRRLRDGDLLSIGKRRWRIVVGAGHSPEHACLYNEEDQLLISGDQVLPRITSSICITVTEPEANPLQEWLNSLKRLRSIPDTVLVLPAHELPFRGLHFRLQQLQQHHELHLDQLMSALESPQSVDQCRALLFPRVRNSFDRLMAIGETQAHLNFLMEEGSLQRELCDEVWRYSLKHSDAQAVTLAEDIHV
ncbi:MAG: MBL fold metallo-hydrolase [Gammaproteobacteria bacterium]|nr:MBL fold metallo-hydrolase [Gammaproteobacteria bacterium]